MSIKSFFNNVFFRKIERSNNLDYVSDEECVDLDTGEIIEKSDVVRTTQQFYGIEYSKENSDTPLYQQNVEPKKSFRVVITGSFDVSRRVIVEELNSLGISVGSSVNKLTDLLIIGQWGREVGEDGVSNKFLQAEKLGVKSVMLSTSEEIFNQVCIN